MAITETKPLSVDIKGSTKICPTQQTQLVLAGSCR